MLDTNFIKQHVERRDQIDRRTGDDTIIRVCSDRRRQDRRSSITNCDIKFTKIQAAAILAIPVLGSIYIIYKLLTN